MIIIIITIIIIIIITILIVTITMIGFSPHLLHNNYSVPELVSYPVKDCKRSAEQFRCTVKPPLFRTLIRSPPPPYFERRSNSLGFTLLFQSFTISYFELGYFEFPAISNSSFFPYTLIKSTPLFRTCQKQSSRRNSQAANKE